MSPERVAGLVRRWIRAYTRTLPASVAERRVEEIDADVSDHIAHARSTGASEHRIAISVLSRMVRGAPADVAWREHHRVLAAHRLPGGGPVKNATAYRIALFVALGTALSLAWGIAAMGIIGAEGDPFDRLYFGVVAIGIVGAVLARFQPSGMVRALSATAIAQAVVTVLALLLGKQDVPVSSVAEIVGLNGFFIALFVGAAWLFHRADRPSRPVPDRSVV